MRSLGLVLLIGCVAEPTFDPEVDGPWSAGVWTGTAAGDPALPLTIWFPTEDEAAAVSLPSLSTAPEVYDALLDAAPAGCPTRELALAVDAVPAEGPLPLATMSHCHTCLGLSGATIGRRLATHGWVVATVDHVGNTVFDREDGAGGEVDDPWLDRRSEDAGRLLDAMLDGAGPEGLVLDADRIATMGHSFGAMTAGRHVAERAEIDAAVFLAAPPVNPLYRTASAEDLDLPTMFLVAVEDNSISEFGNNLLRDNALRAQAPSYSIELADAGHWSVSDVVGLNDFLMAGCGEDSRQTDGQPFTYADPAASRELAATEVLTFLEASVNDDEDAWAALQRPSDAAAERVLRLPPVPL